MNRSDRLTNGINGSKKRTFRFPAFPLFLLFLFASCGGGGGGGESSPPSRPYIPTTPPRRPERGHAERDGESERFGHRGMVRVWNQPESGVVRQHDDPELAAGTITQPVNQRHFGLTPGTTYYFRLVASNADGWVEGKIFSFTTRNPPPAVTTDNATSITLNGATLNGSVNPNGAATIAWFEYGHGSEPGLVHRHG